MVVIVDGPLDTSAIPPDGDVIFRLHLGASGESLDILGM